MTVSQDPPQEYLVFRLAEVCYAISANCVVEIFRAASLVPFPQAPAVVEGVINLRGQLVPVLDIRSRFRHSPKPISITDHLIVARAGDRTVALRVDQAIGIERLDPADIEEPVKLASGIGQVAGIARRPDGILLIHDLAGFLTAAEAEALSEVERAGAAA